MRSFRSPAAFVLVLIVASLAVHAGDWINAGGNAGRNGLSDEIGPTAADQAWSGARTSLIAWLPVTEGNRVFTVRQARWPYQQPNDAYVVAMDLTTGEELWAIVLPYNSGDWTPWIAGVRDGKVYCSRSGNGASVSALMYALDAEDGHTVWVSQAMQDAGPYDGTVFAEDGDLIVGSFEDIWRIDAADGHTVWHATRVGSVSSSCGGARFGDAFYIADATGGGHVLVRYDVATGQRLYQSPIMPGFTLQNTPLVGPDGTIYLSRTQNNPSVDYIYAFTDTGTEFVEKWHIPSFWNPFAEFGVGPDGSVYFAVPGPRLARIDPANGGILNQTDVLPGFTAAHVAIDADGKVYLSNSAFATGRLYAYDADLTPGWDVPVTNINIGGPALGQNGTLVVCGVGTDMRAYRTTDPTDMPDPFADASTGLRLACAPNPFRDATTISFALAQPGPVTCEIFDATGRCVRTLLRGDGRDAGEQAVVWRGDGAGGERVAPGVYYYRVATGAEERSGRVLLTR
jgi:hypothetical protein